MRLMPNPTVAPFGSWRSPFSAAAVARAGTRLLSVATTEDSLYWVESRPTEGGRNVLVRRGMDGTVEDVTPPNFNARTRVHEYGGGACLVAGTTAFFSNYDDQRLYRQQVPDGVPQAVTPEPDRPAGMRYADGRLAPDGATLVCVRERHDRNGVSNEIVVMRADGSGRPRVLVSGNDFYASPRLSPDGRRIAWATWNHPLMPWEGCELWLAEIGPGERLQRPRKVAGSTGESAYQPEWSQDGAFYFLSDAGGWWNLHRLDANGAPQPVLRMEADFGEPQWSFDASTYACLPDGRIACTWITGGEQSLGLLDPSSGRLAPIELPFSSYSQLRSHGDTLAFLAAGPLEPHSVVTLDLREAMPEPVIVRRAFELEVEQGYVSVPRPMEFATDDGDTAYALFYAPANPDFTGPPDERPPLLVMSHGGPTGRAEPTLDPATQFWTSRGFAVVDVNYGGSSGYGRAYRERLNGRWGIVDVADCVNAARYLAKTGEVDGERMAIRGGSAGGYTTLCALTFYDVFAAGASYFGVADLVTFTGETHKFESHYLDSLVGPYPKAADLYRERSPANFADRLSCPIILFQGLEDEVVPPSQSEVMLAALRAKGIPHAYLAFEGEQHGFRRADTLQASREAELSFYAQIFGFEPADPIPRLELIVPTG
jgi:dipeptidyl aminopeptidase/acylaminoacyl peptidase